MPAANLPAPTAPDWPARTGCRFRPSQFRCYIGVEGVNDFAVSRVAPGRPFTRPRAGASRALSPCTATSGGSGDGQRAGCIFFGFVDGENLGKSSNL